MNTFGAPKITVNLSVLGVFCCIFFYECWILFGRWFSPQHFRETIFTSTFIGVGSSLGDDFHPNISSAQCGFLLSKGEHLDFPPSLVHLLLMSVLEGVLLHLLL
jgi:hypothetical protein